MGEVWRAKHRLLARPAAIKLIRPVAHGGRRTGVSEDARRRFEREAQVIAQPALAAHREALRLRRRRRRRVLLRDGAARRARRRHARAPHGPIPAERAIHLLRQVCHSLSEAESRGLVHRDIKPANIFLCRYGEDYDFVKVLDFGIVKAAHDTGGDRARAHARDVVHGHAGVHRARAGAGRRRRRRPRRHLRDRLRRLLAADRAARCSRPTRRRRKILKTGAAATCRWPRRRGCSRSRRGREAPAMSFYEKGPVRIRYEETGAGFPLLAHRRRGTELDDRRPLAQSLRRDRGVQGRVPLHRGRPAQRQQRPVLRPARDRPAVGRPHRRPSSA